MAKSVETPKSYQKEMEGKGFKRRGGEVLKWEAGMTVEGTFASIIPARNEESSPVLVLDTVDGRVRYWCPTILESQIDGATAGTHLVVICLGQNMPIKNRKTLAWNFEVYEK